METLVPDFSHLSKYAVTPETTAEYTFDRIEGDPSVVMAPAHECNPAYHRERLALTLRLADQMASTKPGPTTADEVMRQSEEARDHDRRLLAHHCARSWGTSAPVDAKGKAVEFSADNCYEFFRALPPEMFDPLRNFTGNLFNFFPERNRQLTERDAEQLGNS